VIKWRSHNQERECPQFILLIHLFKVLREWSRVVNYCTRRSRFLSRYYILWVLNHLWRALSMLFFISHKYLLLVCEGTWYCVYKFEDILFRFSLHWIRRCVFLNLSPIQRFNKFLMLLRLMHSLRGWFSKRWLSS
jgi:hypothetical protein